VSDKSPTLELRELSLAIETPRGLVVVVGCSHPGVERILESAAAIDERIHLLAGGLHLVVTEDPEIERLTGVLRDGFHVEYVAPGHCTGEPAFAALRRAFGDRYLYAGLGSVIAFDRGRDSTERAAAGANAGATD
jgi:7,8-dihydropterin-6-yl-methyl-4-(beta-D-ribofuranosyl)aminobenzene 5'-phosphate synthase